MTASDTVLLSIDPNTDHPIAGDTVLYTASNDAVFGGTVEEGHADLADPTSHRFRIVGHDGLFFHESDAWRSRIISRPAIEHQAATVGTATVACPEGEQRTLHGAWVTTKGGTYFTPFEAPDCGHNMFYGEMLLQFVPDDRRSLPTREQRAQVVDLLIAFSNDRADEWDTADKILALLTGGAR